MTRILLILICLLGNGLPAQADLYKWVDTNGKVHYGDGPPVDCVAESIEMPPGPSETEVQKSKEKANRLIEQQRERDQARQLKKKIKHREEMAKKAEIKKQCRYRRSRLHLLMQRGIITYSDLEGNIYRPTDQEREQEIIEQKQFIQEKCN